MSSPALFLPIILSDTLSLQQRHKIPQKLILKNVWRSIAEHRLGFSVLEIRKRCTFLETLLLKALTALLSFVNTKIVVVVSRMKGWSLREKFKCYLVPDLTHTHTHKQVFLKSILFSSLLFLLLVLLYCLFCAVILPNWGQGLSCVG